MSTHSSLRKDHKSNEHKGGMLAYIDTDFRVLNVLTSPHQLETEYQAFVISPKLSPDIRLAILSIYKHPQQALEVFLRDLELIISLKPQGLQCIMVGDFNIDHGIESNTRKRFQALMSYYEFYGIFDEPTHRRGDFLDNVYI